MREPSAEELAAAEAAHGKVADAWMALPGVTAVRVGFLPDEHGAPTESLGLVVTVDPDAAEELVAQVPEEVDGTPVTVERGSFGPQAPASAP